MCIVMFDGRNILPGLPDELIKIVDFLNGKAVIGEFEFCDSVSYWENNEDIITPLGLGHNGRGYYFAEALACIASFRDGNIVFTENDNVWRWAWSLHIVSGIAGWSPIFMKKIIVSFEREKDEIERLINWAVQTYGSAYYDDAVVLMSMLPQYRMSILSGLMENDFERYCIDNPPKENLEEFANAFVKTNLLNEEMYNKAFDMVMAFPSFSSTAAMTFFLSIKGKLSGQKEKTCEQKIVELLQGDTLAYVVPVCDWLYMQQEVTPLIEKCTILLIKGLGVEYKERDLKSIDSSISLHFKNPELLTKLFTTVAEHLQPTDILTMEGCLRNLHKNRGHFLKMALSFIIHPKGLYRIVGRRLWDNYHLESSDFDPQKELEEGLQCLFIISMLQDYGNPETRLPKLLPLLESTSELVRNILMGQLEPYLDDYMGHVINALDKQKIENKYVGVIKQYYESRADAIEKRRSMKELSPRYCYMAEFQETMRLQKMHMQEKIREAEKKHKGFMKDLMMKQVALARGGGWRDNNGNIQHLMPIKFSVPSRQLVQSMTPMEQEEWINELMKDWNDTTGNN